ncbi:conjugal transfer protein, partial [Micromonospora sp. RL09-050-HVF-A]|nr:conjugal transfer protein [Micromonospora sp. RL09-050-HVF-A]
MSRPAGPRGGHDDAGLIAGGIAALALVLAVGAWLPVLLTRPPGYTAGGPIRVALAVLRGEITWTTACTLVVVAEVAVLALLTTAAVTAWRWSRRRRTRVDSAARRMATRTDLAHLGPRGVADSGRRLRPSLA